MTDDLVFMFPPFYESWDEMLFCASFLNMTTGMEITKKVDITVRVNRALLFDDLCLSIKTVFVIIGF